MHIGCTLPLYLCFVNEPKGLRQVNPKLNMCVMQVKLLALSEKQIEDLRSIFMEWWKDEENRETLIFAGYEEHNPVAKLFLREVAEAINCDVTIMTKEEHQKDRNDWYSSMEGLGSFDDDRIKFQRFLDGLEY